MRLVETPPIRRLFVPDKGYILIECDLKRADPQICAKESGEESLLQALREGADIYTDMGKWLYEKSTLTQEQRQWNKNAINGANYYLQAKTAAATLHTTQEKAAAYIERWLGKTGLYPGIGKWHHKVNEQLRRTMTVYNVYGFRRFYTDRYENLLPKALAWICSSAVSVTINRGMKHVFGVSPFMMGRIKFHYDNEGEMIGVDDIPEEELYDPWSGKKYEALSQVQLLMQIHDSIICQIPAGTENELIPHIKERMEVEIPYETPLIIPITIKIGTKGEAWGDLQSWNEAA